MSAEILDSRASVDRLDPQGLLERIEGLPDQCEAAWEQAQALSLPQTHRDDRDVLILGMGGSGIAGSFLQSLATPQGSKPVHVARGYDVPAWVGQNTLVVACSHSGNTEETLSAFRQVIEARASLVVITTGGEIGKIAADASATVFTYQSDGEPRSAIGHQLMALLRIGEQAGLVDSQAGAVSEAVNLMREQRSQLGFDSPLDRNPAKQLAVRLHGNLPVVVGAGLLDVAAYRWKTQINENADSWAMHETLPELDHNSIVGFGLPDVPNLHVVFLRHADLHPRLLLRYAPTAEALEAEGVAHETVDVEGESNLAQVLTAIYYGDFVSYYLGLMNDIEPSAVKPIDTLKEKLGE